MYDLFRNIKNPKRKKFLEAVFPDMVFWTIIVLMLIFTLNWQPETLRENLREIFITFMPFIVAIYVHFFIFRIFLLKRRYFWYAVFCIAYYAAFFYLIRWIFVTFVPQRHDDIIFSLFFFSFMYIGFRYLITAPAQISKMKATEAQKIKAERDLQEMEAKHAKAELEMLKSQINPHFLFNSLNNIYSLTMIDAEKAGNAILTLSDLMRYNLESAKKKFVTMNHEVEFVNNYIQLETLRLGDSCKISLHTEGDFFSKSIAPMILISFVENCFKHGISAVAAQNFINISIQISENQLIFVTENRVAPSRMELKKKDVKIGIENVKKRLELLYRNQYELKIGSGNDIFTVFLKIELWN